MQSKWSIKIEIWKYEAVEGFKIQIDKVNTCKFCFHLFVLS